MRQLKLYLDGVLFTSKILGLCGVGPQAHSCSPPFPRHDFRLHNGSVGMSTIYSNPSRTSQTSPTEGCFNMLSA